MVTLGMVKKKQPRPYSMKYTARANPRRYLLSGIPPTLWEKARRKARVEHVALRQVLLSLLEEWLQRPRAEPQPEEVAAD